MVWQYLSMNKNIYNIARTTLTDNYTNSGYISSTRAQTLTMMSKWNSFVKKKACVVFSTQLQQSAQLTILYSRRLRTRPYTKAPTLLTCAREQQQQQASKAHTEWEIIFCRKFHLNWSCFLKPAKSTHSRATRYRQWALRPVARERSRPKAQHYITISPTSEREEGEIDWKANERERWATCREWVRERETRK